MEQYAVYNDSLVNKLRKLVEIRGIVDLMSINHLAIGKMGEIATLRHLKRVGFRHIESNYRSKTGEIDLVLEKGGVVHFIEVKTVSRENSNREVKLNVSHGTWHRPEDNVHRDKLRKLMNTVKIWLSQNKYDGKWQIDVASVCIYVISKRATIKMIENIIFE